MFVYQSSGFSALGSGINFGSSSSQPSGFTALKSSIWAGSLSSLKIQYFVSSISYSKSLKMHVTEVRRYQKVFPTLLSLCLLSPPFLIHQNLLLTCYFLVYIFPVMPHAYTHIGIYWVSLRK